MTATAVITLSWSILHPASLFSPIIIHPTKERNSISSIGTVFWVKNVLFCHHPVLSDCESVFWQLQLESLKLAGSRSSGKLSVCRSFHLSVFRSHRLQQKKKKKSKTKEIKPPPKKQNNWLRFNHRWILDVKLWFRFGVFYMRILHMPYRDPVILTLLHNVHCNYRRELRSRLLQLL